MKTQADPDETLWQTNRTIYDPCPPGWHVPQAGENGLWHRAWGSTTMYRSFDNTNKGMNFSGAFSSESNVWYPAAGYYARGTLYGTGEVGTWKSVTPGSPGLQSSLIFTFDKDASYVYLLVNGSRFAATSVRCVKE